MDHIFCKAEASDLQLNFSRDLPTYLMGLLRR